MADLNLKFIAGRLEGNRLLEDYLAAGPEACRFYGGHYAAPGRLEKQAAEADRRLDRQRAAAILSSQRTFPLVREGRERIERFIKVFIHDRERRATFTKYLCQMWILA